MWIWIALFIFIVVSTLLGTVYLTAAVSHFGLIAAAGRLWLRYLISFVIVALVFAVIERTMSLMNAIVVLLHAVCFFLLYGILFWVIARTLKPELKFYVQGWLAVITTAVCLSAGYRLCNHVWRTNYTLMTSKPVGALRIAMFADSHLGTTFDGEGLARHLGEIMEQDPDILLIPGDFVDDGTTRSDMTRACEALGGIRPKYGVWFAPGNHDEGYYHKRDFTMEELVRALEQNDVRVLADQTAEAGPFYLAGRRDASRGPRKEIPELLEGAPSDKYIIVIDHEPSDFEKESRSAADLVVSGHTHGGQLIPINRAGEWFGVNDRTYGHENRNGTDFIVTSGISSWAVKFKTGTKSEYVIIDVKTAP